ncbi:T-cell-interacting, activating receptor on myeloid cells protein 1-like isoform X3 [Antechinus flavipes]|uniref:T-cell-interacting, activating receptor on myeloid cells protein 1-like isoform X2 n=1 Tax=Antechinus flavipes TaxID=38775 RepID=UPI0022367975|nr:T-cell-interacting, activating receptor on myeloid cells protein 1-like isoform X2 [Antechinus flavipes]XP_051845589.1 T-cell-interacting, activating receptor on myeloid cells protein 1-like isoform X3 [Antechinus flavipes]
MSPTVASLLCLGLCLGQKIPSAEGELFRSSIRAVPGSVVSLGAGVSLYCQGPQGNNSFQLWKDENFILQINTSRGEAEFPLRVEGTNAIGHYRCRYWQGPHWSEFSAPLQLLVTGFFSKPSFLVRPGTLVATGETVTLTCQISLPSGIQKLTFFLLKAGVPDPLQSQSTKGHVANFTLPSVKAEDAGNYSCIYSEEEGRRRASVPSELLRLEVTDEKDTHPKREDEKNAHSQEKDSRTIIIVTVSCVSSIFILLCVLFCHRHTRHKSSHGGTPQSPSNSTGISQSVGLTSLPTEKIIYEDVSKGRQIEMQASESEDPHGVTYSQLNTAALTEGQRVPTSTVPEPCIYSTVALP